MQLTVPVLILVAGLGLVAGGFIRVGSKIPNTGIVDTGSTVRGVDLYLQNALGSLQGVKCSIQEVEKIIDVCEQFVEAFDDCDSVAAQKILQLIDAIITTGNEIARLAENICDIEEEEDNGGAESSSTRCANQLASKISSLSQEILQVMTAGIDDSTCVITAFGAVVPKFLQFPAAIAKCF